MSTITLRSPAEMDADAITACGMTSGDVAALALARRPLTDDERARLRKAHELRVFGDAVAALFPFVLAPETP